MEKLNYTVKITFTNGDVEHYQSNTTDIKLILTPFEFKHVQHVDISTN